MEHCEICGKPVPGFEYEYCCNPVVQGCVVCGCMGLPLWPCTCSPECNDVLYGNIGQTFEERRIAAGIKKWTPDKEI